jgi:hypothetical protein
MAPETPPRSITSRVRLWCAPGAREVGNGGFGREKRRNSDQCARTAHRISQWPVFGRPPDTARYIPSASTSAASGAGISRGTLPGGSRAPSESGATLGAFGRPRRRGPCRAVAARSSEDASGSLHDESGTATAPPEPAGREAGRRSLAHERHVEQRLFEVAAVEVELHVSTIQCQVVTAASHAELDVPGDSGRPQRHDVNRS